MAKKKKTSAAKRPSVPEAGTVPAMTAPSEMARPEYEPMSLNDFKNYMDMAYRTQLGYAPQVIDTQRQAQDVLFRNMSALQREQGPLTASVANTLLSQYDPQFRESYNKQQADIGGLGATVGRELAAGYGLGKGLGREVEQSIRGAQTARGNILGAAPTAQEAFGTGQAAINLYQQRVGNYSNFLGQQQNFLQGRNPMDMMTQTTAGFMGSNYYPSQSYVDAGLGVNAMNVTQSGQSAFNATVQSGYSSFQNALQDYNSNQVQATSVNNEGLFNTYDRQAESWMYDEAIRRGLYSTPSVGGSSGGGMMGGVGGTVMKGVGTGLSTGIGLAAAGTSIAGLGVGGTAVAGGLAAAASAAGAAFCWLARRCLPDRWEEFQRYLFTDAPEKLRRLYLYNARRLAREISDNEATKIGLLMDDCLNLRSLA